MPRFVLLLHECPTAHPRPTHCDLMLEAGETLRTWSLPTIPVAWAALKDSVDFPEIAGSDSVAAESLGDHRLAYLDYEGPVGGDRGSVRRIDSGTFMSRLETADRCEFSVNGRTLRGEITLLRVGADQPHWQLSYRGEV